ncbi:MAG: hypothetical protein DRG30_02205, partial [Epsilonproteobacteria bacterium]
MAYIFHNSKSDGTIDTQISSGTDTLFSGITVKERLDGDTEFQKVWITSDVDQTIYVGQNYPSNYYYPSAVFVSANEADAEGDLTGGESKYGASKVISATAESIVCVS